VSLPSAPPGNVTVTVTPSSGIKATPATLAFAPTVFSGTVTVESTATPGTTGTVKFSAPGYADGVVNVTVDQSTNLVVNPASLEIPANGAKSFTVKLAKDPTALVTVTVTPSSGIKATPATLAFASTNFKIDQTVLVSAGPGAVPGEQSVVLDAGSLGKFNLPVTITPASNTIFFIDPANGNDAFPGAGTAAKPWKTVEQALDVNKPSGTQVAAVASAGNNVVVTILGGTYTENVSANINTPILSAGSVTVLQAPFPKTFTLDLATNNVKLTLNKGYKLQDINITSNLPGGGTAVTITHPTAGLASVDVTCAGVATNPVTCVKVQGAGSHILKDVRVDVTDANGNNIGILNNDAGANLSIIGGRVRPTGNNSPITLIDSQGVLTVTGLEVDMTNAGHTQDSKGIILNASPSLVTGSTIKVSNSTNAVGIDVQGTANPSTVVGNTFKGSGNGYGVKGGNNLSPDVLLNNIFSGTFTTQVQP